MVVVDIGSIGTLCGCRKLLLLCLPARHCFGLQSCVRRNPFHIEIECLSNPLISSRSAVRDKTEKSRLTYCENVKFADPKDL